MFNMARKHRQKSTDKMIEYKIKKTRAVRRKQFAKRQAQEFTLFITLVTLMSSLPVFLPRMVWMRKRSGHWWEEIVKRFTPQDWLNNFRVSPATFQYLCTEYGIEPIYIQKGHYYEEGNRNGEKTRPCFMVFGNRSRF